MSEFNETQPENKLYAHLLDDDNKNRLDTLANAARLLYLLCDNGAEGDAFADGLPVKGVAAVFEIIDREIDGIKSSVYETGREFYPDIIAPPNSHKGADIHLIRE
ncbi:hypothetical protein VQ366_001214 [Salmonella enterica]|nr:hypothetical protein [Salmonella enterica]EKO0903481.1 hypothetical protein [Salmonella enterica subsp. enterica]EBT7963337.1 hypothetical protein [Salmonella enterica]ECP4144135.1 hypothetical protein [Salmonella enterica]EDY4583887.1 hypothetical protein [Salmonella enterica]